MSDTTALQTTDFEGEDIIFIEHDGKRLYPVYAVGTMYGYSEKNALEAFRNNLKFLEGNHYSRNIRRFKNTVSVPFLTGEGVLIYTSRKGESANSPSVNSPIFSHKSNRDERMPDVQYCKKAGPGKKMCFNLIWNAEVPGFWYCGKRDEIQPIYHWSNCPMTDDPKKWFT